VFGRLRAREQHDRRGAILHWIGLEAMLLT
jgi:hypothetical protein